MTLPDDFRILVADCVLCPLDDKPCFRSPCIDHGCMGDKPHPDAAPDQVDREDAGRCTCTPQSVADRTLCPLCNSKRMMGNK